SAFRGPDALHAVLGGAVAEPLASSTTDPAIEPAGAYLSAVTVEGFRGIGPEARLDVPPGPGLILVVGRNGSGKSSLAEGLDVLVAADRCLADERRGREKANKDVADSLAPLLTQLRACDDERARRCTEALTGRRPDLDAAAEVLAGADQSTDRDLALLQELAV